MKLAEEESIRSFKPELTPQPKAGSSFLLDKPPLPWDLEIGCGTGDFALFWAQQTQNPVIAIEKTRTRFLKFEQKFKEVLRPPNLYPIHTNAVWWLAHYGQLNMFEHIFLLYSNPYPKHQRWVNRSFMSYLLSLLRPGGKLEMRTNKGHYYREFRDKISKLPFMFLLEDKELSPTYLPQSLFEKKYLERGETCHILKFQKV